MVFTKSSSEEHDIVFVECDTSCGMPHRHVVPHLQTGAHVRTESATMDGEGQADVQSYGSARHGLKMVDMVDMA